MYDMDSSFTFTVVDGQFGTFHAVTNNNVMSCCSSQYCLPKAEKELYEKEERPEAQQEILKRVARELPVYTRTGSGGRQIDTFTFVAFKEIL